MRSRTTPRALPAHSVKDLLSRAAPALTRVTDQAQRSRFWRSWLSTHLPAELEARITGISEQHQKLVIFAESAAWSARLRFALLELEADLRAAAPAQLGAIEVRVLPRS